MYMVTKTIDYQKRKPSKHHLVPATAPSFFPNGSFNSTPAHSPLANSVGPRYLKIPNLLPPTKTSSPIFKDSLKIVLTSDVEFFWKKCLFYEVCLV